MHSSRANLLHKGIKVDLVCPACLLEIDDTYHLFVGCPMVKKTWDLAINHNSLPSFPFPQLPSSIREGLHDLHIVRSIFFSWVVIFLRSIWKSRNVVVFNHEVQKPMDSLLRAKHNWDKRKSDTSFSHSPSTNHPTTAPSHKPTQFIRQRYPLSGYLKLNFDDAYSSFSSATSFVLRD